MDVDELHEEIRKALPDDSVASALLSGDSLLSRWTTDPTGLLLLDSRIYVPDVSDLQLCGLRYKHGHVVAGHYGVNKTLELIRREYPWPGVRDFVKDYCKSCTICKRSKAPRHKLYGTLQQLPIPEKP